MRIPVSNRHQKFGPNMTPLIDVVFLLIIFFLVSSQLAKQEANVTLSLPEASTGSEAVNNEQRRMTLNVRADGSISIGGHEVSASQLEGRLAEAVEIKGSDVEVRIRASRDLPYEEAETLMLACARQGIWNVTFAVYKRQEPLP